MSLPKQSPVWLLILPILTSCFFCLPLVPALFPTSRVTETAGPSFLASVHAQFLGNPFSPRAYKRTCQLPTPQFTFLASASSLTPRQMLCTASLTALLRGRILKTARIFVAIKGTAIHLQSFLTVFLHTLIQQHLC